MKTLLAAVLLLAAVSASAALYFDSLLRRPAHPFISSSALFTSKGDLDGAVADVAVVYHRADPDNSLIPKSWQPFLPPESWSLLELGAGGNAETGFVHAAVSWNVAPALLRPGTAALKRAGGTYAKTADLILQTDAKGTPTGQGVKLDFGWKVNILDHGTVPQLNRISAPPRYGIGYAYQF